MSPPLQVQDTLKRKIRTAGLTIADVSRYLGQSYERVDRLLNGYRRARHGEIRQIERAVDVLEAQRREPRL